MTTKFCTTCQTTQATEGGVVRKSKVTRWICKSCSERKNRSPYQSKTKSNERKASWM